MFGSIGRFGDWFGRSLHLSQGSDHIDPDLDVSLSYFMQVRTYLIKIEFGDSDRNPVELVDIQNEVDEILNLFISTL